jgi:type VI secretion system secreted protein VgrG
MVIAYSQIQLSMEKKLRLEAYDEIVLKTGKASITLKKDGSIIISGSDLKIMASESVNVKAGEKVLVNGSKIKDN